MIDAPMRFGAVEVRPDERRVLVDGQPQALGGRAFDLLLALIGKRGRIVTKNELLQQVWPGLVVEENNLQVQVSTLRKVLGPGAIATIPGRGYRFTLAAAPAASAESERLGSPPTAAGNGTAAGTGHAAQSVHGFAAAPAATAPGRFTLPADAEPIIGREEEVYDIVAALIERRLVNIVGAGGMGKTRLAHAVLRRLREDFVDGAWWVDLAPLSQPEHVPRAIAQSVGEAVAEGDGPDALARALGRRSRMLLVLDNCEQVAAGAASVVATLLAQLPLVRLLLTSRMPLRLAAEQVWRLEALPVPATGATLSQARSCAAFELFETRARASDQRFVIDAVNLPQAIELCRRLEGHPLAIEMAAARAPQLGLTTLLGRLGERLRLLRASNPTQPDRQQTLRATLDWSCSQLDAAQLAVLRRLATFAGSFSLDAAQAVAASTELDEWAVLDALAALVDHSLVNVHTGHGPGAAVNALPGDGTAELPPAAATGTWAPRYRLAETTRLYALEQLRAANEMEATALRHGETLARLADQIADSAWILTRAHLLARFGADQEDLQIAFDAACARGDAALAARTGQALDALDVARGQRADARARAAAARRLSALASDPRTNALLWNLIAPAWTIELPLAISAKDLQARISAWRNVGDAPQRYLALRDCALACARDGDRAGSIAAAAEMRALEDPDWGAALRIEAAPVHADLLDAGPSEAHRTGLLRALDLAMQMGDAHREAWVRLCMAQLATAGDASDEAIRLGRAAVQRLEPLNRPIAQGFAWSNLCAAYLFAGDDGAARQAAAEAFALLQSHPLGATLFCHLALLAARAGNPAEATQLLGLVDGSFRPLAHVGFAPIINRLSGMTLAAITACAGTRADSDADRRGLALAGENPLDDARAAALAWSVLGGQDAQGSRI